MIVNVSDFCGVYFITIYTLFLKLERACVICFPKQSILFIYAIYLTIAIILNIRKSYARFFRDIWTYVDILITCLCWSSVILFTVMVIVDTLTYDHMLDSSGSTFVDFRESGETHFAWVCINAFLLMLTLILVSFTTFHSFL